MTEGRRKEHAEKTRAHFNAFVDRRRKTRPGWTVAAWAKRAGVAEGTVRAFMKGVGKPEKERGLGYENAVALADAEGVSLMEMLGYAGPPGQPPVRYAGLFSMQELLMERDYERLFEREEATPRAGVPARTHVATIAAITWEDTSFNREVPPGTDVVFDWRDTEPRDGKVYVFAVEGAILLRRYRDSDGPVRLEPDSTEAWPTYYPGADGFRVIGCMIYQGRPTGDPEPGHH